MCPISHIDGKYWREVQPRVGINESKSIFVLLFVFTSMISTLLSIDAMIRFLLERILCDAFSIEFLNERDRRGI